MPVAAVVAGLVVAQRVEGHVGGGQLGGDHPFDVELEAGGLEGDADGARVHVEGLGVVPGDERNIFYYTLFNQNYLNLQPLHQLHLQNHSYIL